MWQGVRFWKILHSRTLGAVLRAWGPKSCGSHISPAAEDSVSWIDWRLAMEMLLCPSWSELQLSPGKCWPQGLKAEWGRNSLKPQTQSVWLLCLLGNDAKRGLKLDSFKPHGWDRIIPLLPISIDIYQKNLSIVVFIMCIEIIHLSGILTSHLLLS